MPRPLLFLVITLVALVGCNKPCVTSTDCAGALVCDPQSGACVECLDAPDCDDDNPCTLDACDRGECSHVVRSDGVDCDDDGVCNGGAVCEAGACVTTPAPVCDDGVPCTVNGCTEPGGCTYTPDHDACDDAIPCTTDLCDPDEGCVFVPDHDACDDSVTCTVDTCDPETGCASVPDDALCSGGEACCEDGCAQLETDALNCGGCGIVCEEDQTCFAGLCEGEGECLTPRTANPSFQNPNAWTTAGGATVDPTAAGYTDPGVGVVPFTTGSKLTTTGCLPPLDISPPARLSVAVNASSNVAGPMRLEHVGVGEVRSFTAVPGNWIVFSRCLGEASYAAAGAGDIALALATQCTVTQFCSTSTYTVDRFELFIDETCPLPGTVRNGDMEGAGGWTSSTEQGSSLVLGPDDTGVNRVLIATNSENRCSRIVQGRVSQPLASTLPHAALQLRARSLQRAHSVRIRGGVDLGTLDLPGDDTWHDYRVCLASGSSFEGFVVDLVLNPNVGFESAECPENEPSELWFDDFVVVSDPDLCGD